MGRFLPWLQRCIQHWTRPATPMLISGFLSDLPRSRTDLLVENALLRQQLIVLNRQVRRPPLTNSDRFRLVFLSHFTRFWRQLKTPYRTPRANGICERFMGSLRGECLDHILIHDGKHLQRVVQKYTNYYNQERPHQGIGQRIPNHYAIPKSKPSRGRITSKAILGGLHHSYARDVSERTHTAPVKT